MPTFIKFGKNTPLGKPTSVINQDLSIFAIKESKSTLDNHSIEWSKLYSYSTKKAPK